MSHPSTNSVADGLPSAAKRVWSPYELTQLQRHGVSLHSLPRGTQAPVEYLTGHVDFAGLDFIVTTDTLIPRIETEELVTLAWRSVQARATTSTPVRVLDLGTGCGAIAICLAHQAQVQNVPIQILASDISAPALKVAQQNATQLVPSQTLTWAHSDLFAQISPAQKFDILVANLPYIPEERIPFLEESVKGYEPWVALSGGPDGLALVRKMLADAKTYVHPQGVILLEVDYTHTYETFREFAPDWSVELLFDSLNRNRFARLTQR